MACLSCLMCCVRKEGSHYGDNFTLETETLPTEQDELVIIPGLWSNKAGRVQFSGKLPWQLKGIVTPDRE